MIVLSWRCPVYFVLYQMFIKPVDALRRARQPVDTQCYMQTTINNNNTMHTVTTAQIDTYKIYFTAHSHVLYMVNILRRK